MRRLIVLIVLVMLALGGLGWWLLSGNAAPGPIAPQDAGAAAVEAAVPPEPAPPTVAPAPLPPTPPVTPAPAVNDPAKGVITLRVVDADTEQPLANTLCGMSGVYTSLDAEGRAKESSTGAWYADPEAAMQSGLAQAFIRTDEQGFVRFRVVIDRPLEGSQFTAVMFAQKRMMWRLPTPTGWEPAFEVHDIARRIAALRAAPQNTAIDVRWRRAPRVTWTVRGPDGTPVQGAMVSCFAISVLADSHSAARLSSKIFRDSPDPAQALAALIQSAREDPAEREPKGVMLDFDRDTGRRTDASGACTMYGLFRGEWVFCFRHPMFKPHVESVRLEARDYALQATLRPNGRAALRLVAQVMHGEVPIKDVYFHVMLSGPYGPRRRSTPYPDGSLTLDLPQVAGELTGLLPATYFIEALARGGTGIPSGVASGVLVTLQPGETREVVLPVGDGAAGHWEPVVTLQGERLPAVSFTIRGGRYLCPETFHLENPNQHEVALPPGEYTAEVPGFAPVKLALASGQRRRDEFSFPLRPATFTAARDLFPDDREFGLLLALWHLEDDRLNESEMLERANDMDRGTVVLELDKPRHLNLAPGRYGWSLSNPDDLAGGSLTVSATDANVFTFSLDSMPGVASLEVGLTAIEAAGAELPILVLERPIARDLDADENWTRRNRGNDNSVISMMHLPGRALMFAPPGRWILYAGDQPQFVTVPGSIKLRPSPPPAHLKWTTEYAHESFFVEVIDSSGFARQLPKNTNASVAPGQVRVFARRSGPAKPDATARAVLELAAGEHLIDLDKLAWETCGSFTIECEGRGSQEPTHDAWWTIHPWDNETPLRVLALDRADAAGPAVITPSEDTDWFPGARMAFRFHAHEVPAGRYKVIPWPNAPEKYCVTFTVKAGENTDVMVKGG